MYDKGGYVFLKQNQGDNTEGSKELEIRLGKNRKTKSVKTKENEDLLKRTMLRGSFP
jgi:hypothetical protein